MFAIKKSYSTVVPNLEIKKIWQVWADVNNWHLWQDDIDYSKLEGEFVTGNTFKFKPKGVSEMTLKLEEVVPYTKFVYLTKFPLAKMYGIHKLNQLPQGLKIKTTIKVCGILAPFWWLLVAKNIVKDETKQTQSLINQAKRII